MSECLEQVNWVARRSECLLPDVFRQLREIVHRDIQEANRLSPLCDLNEGFHFAFDYNESREQFSARRVPGKHSIYPEIAVVFTLHDESIRVDCPQHPHYQNGFFQVYSTWKFNEGYCELTVDKTPHELWQISHVALERLVFQLHYSRKD